MPGSAVGVGLWRGATQQGAAGPGAGVDNWLTEDGGNWLTEDGGVWLLD